jgi:hypothetical protein
LWWAWCFFLHDTRDAPAGLFDAMQPYTEGVLPDRVFGKGGRDFSWAEVIPPVRLASKYASNRRFLGWLLRVRAWKWKDEKSE